MAERDHELQNPISSEKLVLLGERLRLGPGSRVLDVASGRGGPALVLARAFGCTIEGIEVAPEFHSAALERAEAEGLEDLLSFRLADASCEALEPAAYDVALRLGATFVYGGLSQTLDALRLSVRPQGHLIVGEPYWRAWPPPDDYEERDAGYASHLGWAIFVCWKPPDRAEFGTNPARSRDALRRTVASWASSASCCRPAAPSARSPGGRSAARARLR